VGGLFSLVHFVVSREATFSMWMLSEQYAGTSSATDRSALLAAGRTLLTLYNGGTFATSYVLGAVSTLLFSAVMVRHAIFGRLVGLLGVLTGLTMLVPANAGPVGLAIAMVSLLPTAVWLILLVPHLLRAARKQPPDNSIGQLAARAPGDHRL
jgi:predicted PurR-regulated permease PerM